jgi:hypothetical protein
MSCAFSAGGDDRAEVRLREALGKPPHQRAEAEVEEVQDFLASLVLLRGLPSAALSQWARAVDYGRVQKEAGECDRLACDHPQTSWARAIARAPLSPSPSLFLSLAFSRSETSCSCARAGVGPEGSRSGRGHDREGPGMFYGKCRGFSRAANELLPDISPGAYRSWALQAPAANRDNH